MYLEKFGLPWLLRRIVWVITLFSVLLASLICAVFPGQIIRGYWFSFVFFVLNFGCKFFYRQLVTENG